MPRIDLSNDRQREEDGFVRSKSRKTSRRQGDGLYERILTLGADSVQGFVGCCLTTANRICAFGASSAGIVDVAPGLVHRREINPWEQI